MVVKNQEYILDIKGMTHEGLGVGKVNDFAVFVKDAIAGETVKTKILAVKKSYAIGRLEEIIRKSSARIQSFCPVFKRCGGCTFQHVDYNKQLEFKENQVRENIVRIGGLDSAKIYPVIGMANPKSYRNKAQYPVGQNPQGPVMGFYAPRSHEIIDTPHCGIQHDLSEKVKKIAMEFIRKFNISIYDEKTGRGLLRHVVIKVGFNTGEVMVLLVVNGEEMPYSVYLLESLKLHVAGLKSVILNINNKKTNVILGKENKVLYGRNYIFDILDKYTFKISHLSFYQVNPVQTKILYGKAVEYASLTGHETVLDIYCGIGTISVFMSGKAYRVYGIEEVPEAIEDARQNAKLNKIANTKFICGKGEEVLPTLVEQGIKADVIIMDPPRKGCDKKVLEAAAMAKPKRIVYISCNPATLARDLKILSELGYSINKVQPLDMFPYTTHVECVVLMSLKDK